MGLNRRKELINSLVASIKNKEYMPDKDNFIEAKFSLMGEQITPNKDLQGELINDYQKILEDIDKMASKLPEE